MHSHVVLFAGLFFFFNATATTEIYTLSLHDALPICSHDPPRGAGHRRHRQAARPGGAPHRPRPRPRRPRPGRRWGRSEEHTSELQSQSNLVCRLLLEKKNKTKNAAKLQTARVRMEEP